MHNETTPTPDKQPDSRPSDRLKAIPQPTDVNVWHLVTEKDTIHIGTINCIVGEDFAKGLVETWNAALAQPDTRQSETPISDNRKFPTFDPPHWAESEAVGYKDASALEIRARTAEGIVSRLYKWLEARSETGSVPPGDYIELLDAHDDKIRDERDEVKAELASLRAQVAACLAAMPCGNVKTHTIENLPGRIEDLAREVAALQPFCESTVSQFDRLKATGQTTFGVALLSVQAFEVESLRAAIDAARK
jgi:hypothetical protein